LFRSGRYAAIPGFVQPLMTVEELIGSGVGKNQGQGSKDCRIEHPASVNL
jgi:hypothetical protein